MRRPSSLPDSLPTVAAYVLAALPDPPETFDEGDVERALRDVGAVHAEDEADAGPVLRALLAHEL